jgi:hypothetical protein
MSTMTFTFALLGTSVLLGWALGGRLSNLMDRRLRWLALAPLGFALQSIPVRGATLAVGLLLASFLILLVFGVANLRVPGIPLLCIGLSMNFAVVAMNGGMPVPRSAVIASGQGSTIHALEHAAVKHHLAGPDDVLMPLADVIAVGPPIHLLFSPGDLAAFAAMAWLVVAGMRRRYSPRHVASRGGTDRITLEAVAADAV